MEETLVTINSGWARYRGATEAEWEDLDPVVAHRVLAVSEDVRRIKVGDGVSHWSDLEYINLGDAEAIQGMIDDAIADLVGGAPGALDTLNEIAAALGDDANLAATLTTAIGLKASQSALDLEASTRAAADTTLQTNITAEASARASAVTAAITTAASDATSKANAAQAAAIAASQPVDSDLTAIAALSTTSFGRSLLALADAAAGRTALGLGSAAVAASTAFDAAGAAAAAQAASQPLDSDLTAIAALSTTSFGRSLLALADAAAGRTALGLGTAATTAATDYVSPTIVDAKGDLIVASAADTVVRKAVGTDGQVLTADAASTGGVKWADAAAGAATRRAMVTLSGPNNSGVVNIAEMAFRMATMVPYNATRMRLRIANYRLDTEAVIAQGATFIGSYVGPQAMDANGYGTAGYSSGPTAAWAGFTLASNGTEYVSEWISTPVLARFTPMLVSLAYSAGGAASSGQGQMFFVSGAGAAAAHVADASAAAFSENVNTPFDVRIEYEFTGKSTVDVVLADSISGFGGGVVNPNHQAWPGLFGKRMGSAVLNLGVGGSKLSDWATTSQRKWQRANPSELTPDRVLINLGTNDVSAGDSLATMKTRFVALVAAIRTLYGSTIPIYAMTVLPRNDIHSTLAANAAAGATSLSLNSSVANSTVIQVGEGSTSESRTTSGLTGSGPYTVTVSALTNAHVIGETVAGPKETVRLGFNAWLRTEPCAIAGTLSADIAVAARYDRSILQPEFDAGDSLHLSAAGQARMAEVVTVTMPTLTNA